jgi:hypothetical protein
MKMAKSKHKMVAGSKVGTSSLAKKDGGMKRAGRGAYKTKNVNKL